VRLGRSPGPSLRQERRRLWRCPRRRRARPRLPTPIATRAQRAGAFEEPRSSLWTAGDGALRSRDDGAPGEVCRLVQCAA
jgi:hypothetical protein